MACSSVHCCVLPLTCTLSWIRSAHDCPGARGGGGLGEGGGGLGGGGLGGGGLRGGGAGGGGVMGGSVHPRLDQTG